MIPRVIPLVVVLTGFILSCGGSHAADFTNKLKTVETTADQRQVEADALAKREKQQNADLMELRQKLIAATESYERKQQDEKILHDKQDALAVEIALKSKTFDERRQRLGKLLSVFLELARQPPESLLLRDGRTADHVHRMMYLHAILPKAMEETDKLRKDLVELGNLKIRLASQERLTAVSGENVNRQRRELDQLIQMRQKYLQKTESEKAQIQLQLASLSGEARNLQQLLDTMTKKQNRNPVQQARPPTRLKWPVAGTQTRHFGDKDRDGVRSEGITFVTLPGAPVVAPAGGRVVFAGVFRNYGPIVILQHEGGYHSFLAGFGRIDADMGDNVTAGEPLGVMPDKAEGTKPELYFEWRRNSEPVDPMRGSGK